MTPVSRATYNNSSRYCAASPLDRDMFCAFKWCTTYKSSGEFHMDYFDNMWWFEKEKDALIFSLKWGS